MSKVKKVQFGIQLSMFPESKGDVVVFGKKVDKSKVVNPLCYEVYPSKKGRCIVLPYIEVNCVKCGKVIVAGRFFYDNGFCYRCEQKRVLKEAILAEVRIRKLDTEVKLAVDG